MEFTMERYLLPFLFLFSSFVFAGSDTSTTKIKQLYVNAYWVMAEVEVDIIGGRNNLPSECRNSPFVAITPTDAGYDIITTTLMMAYAANKTVRFWVEGCSGQNKQQIKIVSVRVYG